MSTYQEIPLSLDKCALLHHDEAVNEMTLQELKTPGGSMVETCSTGADRMALPARCR